MTWINANGDTSLTRPTRVRLPDLTTRTMEAVTDEILAESGWAWVEPVVTSETVEYQASTGTVLITED